MGVTVVTLAVFIGLLRDALYTLSRYRQVIVTVTATEETPHLSGLLAAITVMTLMTVIYRLTLDSGDYAVHRRWITSTFQFSHFRAVRVLPACGTITCVTTVTHFQRDSRPVVGTDTPASSSMPVVLTEWGSAVCW
jgi:hypothetical protein